MSGKKKGESRRDFLKLAVAAPATAAAVAGAPEKAAAETRPVGKGLRKTAHVKAYLESARF
ncbi:twin-arginine translocation signal domain-containing protein [Pikeienuella piscinae]|uniref:Twin-arginine translocation signal domain-containing protein n=1 Tax=Pikeienuella piscinae TaxID=2748098 RepID=A0A7L5BUW5_9RHOB|nr:twin-arginine translocation signal domain-containing protein [Pikeienuella piscinae]QIE55605.1 twin-arginine translocation signal domain-containing protein [Pikeienuella piscinae]